MVTSVYTTVPTMANGSDGSKSQTLQFLGGASAIVSFANWLSRTTN